MTSLNPNAQFNEGRFLFVLLVRDLNSRQHRGLDEHGDPCLLSQTSGLRHRIVKVRFGIDSSRPEAALRVHRSEGRSLRAMILAAVRAARALGRSARSTDTTLVGLRRGSDGR